ncbi:MAG TPA: AAA family ATPase [Planctomycetota bacterium]
MDTTRLIAELSRPGAYPHPVAKVDLVQTHASLLFFAGERVYKVKKAVDLGFLDFRSLLRRRHYCAEEVRLNARLAPRVHLGVAPIVRTADGHLRVHGEGEALEWAVEMVRLPASRMLSSCLDRGEIDNDLLNAMAARLAEFHAGCPTGPGVDEFGSPDAIAANADENFAQLHAFVGAAGSPSAAGIQILSPEQSTFLREWQLQCVASLRGVMEDRVRRRRIRDGHGDLHAGNICLLDTGIVAYDCIEFASRFRCGDVAADLAFLAMDLDFRGFPAFSDYLVKRYAGVAGDAELSGLMDFYKSYRAMVRAKVAALTAADPATDGARRTDSRRTGMRYAQLATAYALPPALILLCGLPATGKTWLARHLAVPLRARVLRSDVRRKLAAGMPPSGRAGADFEAGLYTPERTARNYQSMLRDARRDLRSGRSVIVDASFSRREFRALFTAAAAQDGWPYFLVHVTAPEDVVQERLARRERDDREASDADLAVYLQARAAFEEPSEIPARRFVKADSGEGPPEEHVGLVIDRRIALGAPG